MGSEGKVIGSHSGEYSGPSQEEMWSSFKPLEDSAGVTPVPPKPEAKEEPEPQPEPEDEIEPKDSDEEEEDEEDEDDEDGQLDASSYRSLRESESPYEDIGQEEWAQMVDAAKRMGVTPETIEFWIESNPDAFKQAAQRKIDEDLKFAQEEEASNEPPPPDVMTPEKTQEVQKLLMDKIREVGESIGLEDPEKGPIAEMMGSLSMLFASDLNKLQSQLQKRDGIISRMEQELDDTLYGNVRSSAASEDPRLTKDKVWGKVLRKAKTLRAATPSLTRARAIELAVNRVYPQKKAATKKDRARQSSSPGRVRQQTGTVLTEKQIEANYERTLVERYGTTS